MDKDVLTAEDVMSHNLGERMNLEKTLFNGSFEVKVTDYDEILANVTSVLDGWVLALYILFFKWVLNFQLSADEYVLSYERFWEAGAPFSGAHWLSLLIIHVIIILIINITSPLPCGVDILSLLIPLSYHHYQYQ